MWSPICNGQWVGGVCGSWGKGSHLGSQGARSARREKRLAVGFRQWRRRDIARWPMTQETGLPYLQETFMYRVCAVVHCIAVIQYNHNRNHVSLYYLFPENKSFGTNYHLHSSSDVWEVVSSTLLVIAKNRSDTCILKIFPLASQIFIFYLNKEYWRKFERISVRAYTVKLEHKSTFYSCIFYI